MNISNSLMKLKNRIIFNKFSKFANPKKYEWHWDKKSFNRIALINYLISKTGGWESDYLEIGCNKNVLFNSIAVETKNFQTGQAWQNNFNNFNSICYFIYSDAGF